MLHKDIVDMKYYVPYTGKVNNFYVEGWSIDNLMQKKQNPVCQW